jgi:hypothetical protein
MRPPCALRPPAQRALRRTNKTLPPATLLPPQQVDELLVAAGAAADAKGVLRPLRAEVQEVVQARAHACMQRDWHALPSFLSRLRFATLLTLSPRDVPRSGCRRPTT